MLTLCGSATDDIRDEFVGTKERGTMRMRLCSGMTDVVDGGSGPAMENMKAVESVVTTRGLIGCVLSHAGEHTGVLTVLKKKYRNAHIASALGGNLANLLAVCARFGQLAIVTNCDTGALPPEVVPYLRDGAGLY